MHTQTYIKAVVLFLLLVSTSVGAVLIEQNWAVNTAIPDNDDTGLADTVVISSMADTIVSIEVDLKISGVSSSSPAFGGDLFVTLQNEDSGFAVLLNRVGKTSTNPFGFDMNGFDVTFTSTGDDIHLAEDHSPSFDSEDRLIGDWGVDGRNVDPDVVLDTDPRTAGLDTIVGSDPNGSWTLFVADTSANGTATLDSWGVTIQAIPEPNFFAMLGSILALVMFIRREKR